MNKKGKKLKKKTKFMWEKSDDGSLCIFFCRAFVRKKSEQNEILFFCFFGKKKTKWKEETGFPRRRRRPLPRRKSNRLLSFGFLFVFFVSMWSSVRSISYRALSLFSFHFFTTFLRFDWVFIAFFKKIELNFFFPKQNESHSSSDALGLHLELDFTEFFLKFF